MFVNNIVLNKHIDESIDFSEFLKSVNSDVTLCISNQPYPYEVLQKKLGLNSNNSLLDVMFTYQNTANSSLEIDGKSGSVLTANTKTSKFNLWLEIIPESATFNLEYNTDLFKSETAKSILEHYLFVLNQICKNEMCILKDFEMITPREEKLLEDFNDTSMPINSDTVASIFEEQVLKTPKSTAVSCSGKSLTYEELNDKANSLAHYLIDFGIKPNDIICIMTNRSLETIVSMLGILKAGAAFFNVDPTYPADRTAYYIKDSNTQFVLTQKDLLDKVGGIKNHIEIDLSNDEIYGKKYDNPNVKQEAQNLAYIIYTSGSTGTPKGVMLNQVRFCKYG